MIIRIFFLFFILLTSCSQISYFESSQFENKILTFYVSPDGNDKNPGTKDRPILTIQEALNRCNIQGSNKPTNIRIYLERGIYKPGKGLMQEGSGVYVPFHLSNVMIFGGWDKGFTTNTNYSILDGEYKLYHILMVEGYRFFAEKLHIKCGYARGSSKYNPIISYPINVFYDYDNANYRFLFVHTYYGGGVFAVTRTLRMIDIIMESNYAYALGMGAFLFGKGNFIYITSNLSWQLYESYDSYGDNYSAIWIENNYDPDYGNLFAYYYRFNTNQANRYLYGIDSIRTLRDYDIITNFYNYESVGFINIINKQFSNYVYKFENNPYNSSIVYLAEYGSDNNDGLSPLTPVRSLEKAYEIALTNKISNIYVTTGKYYITKLIKLYDNIKIIGGFNSNFITNDSYSEFVAYSLIFRDYDRRNTEIYNIKFEITQNINSYYKAYLIELPSYSKISNCIFINFNDNVSYALKVKDNTYVDVVFSNTFSGIEVSGNKNSIKVSFINCTNTNSYNYSLFYSSGINNKINIFITNSKSYFFTTGSSNFYTITGDGNTELLSVKDFESTNILRNILLTILNNRKTYYYYEFINKDLPISNMLNIYSSSNSTLKLVITNISNTYTNMKYGPIYIQIDFIHSLNIVDSIIENNKNMNYIFYFTNLGYMDSYASNYIRIYNCKITNNHNNFVLPNWTSIFSFNNIKPGIEISNNIIEVMRNNSVTNLLFNHLPNLLLSGDKKIGGYPLFINNTILKHNNSLNDVISYTYEYSNNTHYHKTATYNDINDTNKMTTLNGSTNNNVIQ